MSETWFYVLAALTVASASGVVTFRNPVHSALSLVMALFLVAVCFASLGAHLVAALQIIVYAGAVMVLFLFVIMLLNLGEETAGSARPLVRVLAAGGTTVSAVLIASLVWKAVPPTAEPAVLPAGFGTTKALARSLFGDYLVAFELTSLLLLVAVVGAVVLARRDRPSGPDQRLDAGERGA